MVISKRIWNRYQELRTMRYAEGITPEKEKWRSDEVWRMHLAIFYNIPEPLEGLLDDEESVYVDRPWSKYREVA